MKTAPMAGKSCQPSHEPPCIRGTGTGDTVETVERGRETGWEGSCLGDELPLQNRQKTPPVHMPCYDPMSTLF